MALTPFRKINTSSYELGQVQNNVADALQSLSAAPYANGSLVKCTLTAQNDTRVNHGLGREVQGWLVLSVNKPCEIWLSNNANSTPTTSILMANNAPSDAAVTFWFF